jgi:hypothetical protein
MMRFCEISYFYTKKNYAAAIISCRHDPLYYDPLYYDPLYYDPLYYDPLYYVCNCLQSLLCVRFLCSDV